jgi:hypothetical protein
MLVMKKLFIILVGCAPGLFLACKASPEKNEQASTATEQHHSTYTAEDGHTIGMNVQLNNGAKWEANLETTRGIDVMRGILIEFPANPTVEDYRGLNKKLAVEFQNILQRCTMSGEAHEQLHNYLMPLKGMIDKMGTETLENCNATLPDLKEYVLKYSHFFYS